MRTSPAMPLLLPEPQISGIWNSLGRLHGGERMKAVHMYFARRVEMAVRGRPIYSGQAFPVATSCEESGDGGSCHSYRTPAGVLYEFHGWPVGQSPSECWRAGDWLGCLHGCVLCFFLLGDYRATQAAVADDGLLHELVHLASGTPICTHTGHEQLADQVVELETRLATLLRAEPCSPPAAGDFRCVVAPVQEAARIQVGPLDVS
ncbi:hypothetical protein [Achromobacter insolitus]|uniref:hypothetical protein n=1 Tax=Achromobacter insolitus TaxID=217204 RepID=UPI001EEEF38C|nr:hypothetical protein [Achromobacter insolitus]